jgi:hypothetical protein
MASNYICYGGIGSLEGGTHTQKEFLDSMDKHFNTECSTYTKSLQCKSCKDYTKELNKEVKKQIRYKKQNKLYTLSKKRNLFLGKQYLRCNTCKKKHTRKCTLKEYIAFSGAELGKC